MAHACHPCMRAAMLTATPSYRHTHIRTHARAHACMHHTARLVALTSAGSKHNKNGVLTHCSATVLWEDGRRAMFDCGFDRCLTQLMEVSLGFRFRV